MARCHLYARISGNPTRHAPRFIEVNEFSAPLAKFAALLTPDLATALDAEAPFGLGGMGPACLLRRHRMDAFAGACRGGAGVFAIRS